MKDYLESLGMELVVAQPEHIPDDQIENDVIWERIQGNRHEANTLMDGGKVVMLGGYQHVNPHTAEIWSHIVDHSYWKTCYKVADWLLNDVYLTRYQRCQSVVDAEDKTSQRWNEQLGFELETRLKQYKGPNHDCLLYRRIK